MRHFATGVPCKARRCRGHDGVRKCSPPNDTFAPRAREDFFVGMSSERSKTSLVELEAVSSYVETGCVDAELEEREEREGEVGHEMGYVSILGQVNRTLNQHNTRGSSNSYIISIHQDKSEGNIYCQNFTENSSTSQNLFCLMTVPPT